MDLIQVGDSQKFDVGDETLTELYVVEILDKQKQVKCMDSEGYEYYISNTMWNYKKASGKRYRLNRKVKAFAKVRSRMRTIEMSIDKYESLNDQQKEEIKKLQAFGYVVQTIIT